MTDSVADGYRLFFAALPESETLHQLEATLMALPADLGRLVPAPNLHLSLAFVGAVSGVHLECLRMRARRVVAPEITLCLEHFGHFAHAEVLWIGPQTVPVELSELVAQLTAVVSACGVAPDTRPYVPHVTLARRVRRLPLTLELTPVAWRARGFALMESMRAPHGTMYRIVERYEPYR